MEKYEWKTLKKAKKRNNVLKDNWECNNPTKIIGMGIGCNHWVLVSVIISQYVYICSMSGCIVWIYFK